MYGPPVARDSGTTHVPGLLRVPHTDGSLASAPPGLLPAAAAGVSDNLPAAWDIPHPQAPRS
jgi:hypothetical protein